MGISWVFTASYCQCNIFVSAGSVAAFEDIGDTNTAEKTKLTSGAIVQDNVWLRMKERDCNKSASHSCLLLL